MKVKLDGKDYELNVQEAKDAGFLKEILRIPCFRIGDVYRSKNAGPVLIVQSTYPTLSKKTLYNIAGLDGLALYSNFVSGVTEEKILQMLNAEDYEFIRNINSDINALLDKRKNGF